MSWRRSLVFGLASVVAACGGGGPSGPNQGGGLGSFSAVIDGAAWSAQPIFMTGLASEGGTFTFGGTNAAGNTSLSLTLVHVGAPGTYPLGVSGTTPGGTGIISMPPNSYASAQTGASGSVVVSAVSASHIAGSFSFTATPVVGGGANKSVTQGLFDITFPSPGDITIAPNAGSTFGGTLNGQPWNAAGVVIVSHPSSGVLTIGASNNGQNINVIISGFTGVGTYALGSGVARTMQVTNTGTVSTWGGTQATSLGVLTVTAYNANRIQGTFSAALQGSLGTAGSATLTGTFNVGL